MKPIACSREYSALRCDLEPMEPRQLLSGAVALESDRTAPPHRNGAEAALTDSARRRRVAVDRTELLKLSDVKRILAQAASQASEGQAIVVVDREGFILGIFGMKDVTEATIIDAAKRARTAAYFQSTQQCFTTRTAR